MNFYVLDLSRPKLSFKLVQFWLEHLSHGPVCVGVTDKHKDPFLLNLEWT